MWAVVSPCAACHGRRGRSGIDRAELRCPSRRRPVALLGRSSRRLVTAPLAGLVLALVLPVTVDASTPCGSAGRAGPGQPSIGWTACGSGLECASVLVPLDWRHLGGPTISLAVTRHLASRPGQRIGSLFVNPGGPGDSGVGYVAQRGAALDALTGGRFDIVGWDIRGSAGSAPVLCFADAAERASFWKGLPVPTTRAEQRQYLAKTIELARRCGERNGELLATSPPPTPPGTWTTCASWSVTGGSPTSGSPTAPSSARRTPTCSRAGSGPWRWTAWWTPSPPPPAPRRCWRAVRPTPTGCSGSS